MLLFEELDHPRLGDPHWGLCVQGLLIFGKLDHSGSCDPWEFGMAPAKEPQLNRCKECSIVLLPPVTLNRLPLDGAAG